MDFLLFSQGLHFPPVDTVCADFPHPTRTPRCRAKSEWKDGGGDDGVIMGDVNVMKKKGGPGC